MRFKVEDESMYPTLKSGDYLLVNKLTKKISDGVIVVFKHKENFLVKRVQRISGDKFFVAGDNKLISNDSRSFGAIDKKLIVGKVLFNIKM